MEMCEYNTYIQKGRKAEGGLIIDL